MVFLGLLIKAHVANYQRPQEKRNQEGQMATNTA